MSFSHLTAFFARRWNSTTPLRVLLWRDVLTVGSVINLVFSFAALMLAAQGAAMYWAVTVHLAPVPYNLFLLACVWRAQPWSALAMAIASVWFVVMLVV